MREKDRDLYRGLQTYRLSNNWSAEGLLEALQKQVGELISGSPEEKQQFKKMVADRLKKMTKGGKIRERAFRKAHMCIP
jgi:hypothetical protein